MKGHDTMKLFSAILAVLSLAYSGEILAQRKSTDAHAKQIESVLDRLEKRLIDKESSPLTQEENERAAVEESSNPNKKQPEQRYVPKAAASIKGQTQSGKNIMELQKKLNEYDNRIEILESDMRRVRSNLNDAAVTDNVVSLQIKTDPKRPVTLKTLAAQLDGNTLYSQIDPAGLWIPSKMISLFYGPLKPGAHKLDITTTLATSPEDAASASTWKQKALTQSFEFNIPEGKQRKSITVEIGQSPNGDGSPVAVLYDSEVK